MYDCHDIGLAQFDTTMDFKGTFYELNDWELAHQNICHWFKIWKFGNFTDNGNSFRSCFQF